jgi:hypothetical protein
MNVFTVSCAWSWDVRPMEMEEKRGASSLSDACQSMYRQDLAILCISEASTPVFQDRCCYPQIRASQQLSEVRLYFEGPYFAVRVVVYVDDPMTIIPIRFLAKHSTIPFWSCPLSRWVQAVTHALTFRLHVSAIVCGSGTIF